MNNIFENNFTAKVIYIFFLMPTTSFTKKFDKLFIQLEYFNNFFTIL